jgi:hypothetical protein
MQENIQNRDVSKKNAEYDKNNAEYEELIFEESPLKYA